MPKTNVISVFFHWLGTTEMFARPSKLLPGTWHLFEYYTESEAGLENYKQDDLAFAKQFLTIDFKIDNSFVLISNIFNSAIAELNSGNWKIEKNFVTLYHEQQRKAVEFQFAIEKGTLKLLKKDRSGKIVFFGFFKKPD